MKLCVLAIHHVTRGPFLQTEITGLVKTIAASVVNSNVLI